MVDTACIIIVAEQKIYQVPAPFDEHLRARDDPCEMEPPEIVARAEIHGIGFSQIGDRPGLVFRGLGRWLRGGMQYPPSVWR